MARWAPARADVIDEYAAEVLEVFARGRILLGLDRDDPDVRRGVRRRPRRGDHGARRARGAPSPSSDEQSFRTALLGPFRAGALLPGDRAVLVVQGQGLLEPGVVGLWHATAWLDVPGAPRIDRRTVPRTRAAATFDLSDPAHPRRVFADAC